MSSIEPTPSSNARDGVEQVGHQHAVDDETRVVAAGDGLFAHRLDEGARSVDDLGVAHQRRHHLDQFHYRHRIEEMESDDALGSCGGSGDLGDRQRRGIAGEDAIGSADLVQFGEQAVLDAKILDHRLDHQITRREIGQRDGRPEPVPCLQALLGRELSLGDGAVQRRMDAIDARGERPFVDLAYRGFVAGAGTHLGDTRTHQSATDDRDSLDAHYASSWCVDGSSAIVRS